MMNKAKINDIVFEALFRQAVIDEFNEELDLIPSNEELSALYPFTPEFESRMTKLIIKDRRKSTFKKIVLYSKRIALIFIITLGLLFGTLLFNSEVRAAVGGIIIEWYEKFTSFTFREEGIVIEKKDWELGYLPQNYKLVKEETLGRITYIEFRNNFDEKIRFSYRPEDSNTSISIDNENHTIERTQILGNEAFSAISEDEQFDNGLIWNMKSNTFDLWGKISVNELIKIAESIREK